MTAEAHRAALQLLNAGEAKTALKQEPYTNEFLAR